MTQTRGRVASLTVSWLDSELDVGGPGSAAICGTVDARVWLTMLGLPACYLSGCWPGARCLSGPAALGYEDRVTRQNAPVNLKPITAARTWSGRREIPTTE